MNDERRLEEEEREEECSVRGECGKASGEQRKGVAGRVNEVNKVSMGTPFEKPPNWARQARNNRVSWYCQTNK